MLNKRDEQVQAANTANAANAQQDSWVDEICASIGARYHDLELYDSAKCSGHHQS